MAINGILDQIQSDNGVPGARVRKFAQRAKDANPVREGYKQSAVAPAAVVVEEDEFGSDEDLSEDE